LLNTSSDRFLLKWVFRLRARARGPLSKAPRKEDLAVAAAAIWINKMKWFKAMEIAEEAYTRADA
jgi:hypothetical protein